MQSDLNFRSFDSFAVRDRLLFANMDFGCYRRRSDGFCLEV